MTGAIRCLYGSKDAGKTAPVRVRLTQYSIAAAAQKQLGVDVQTAEDAGATITKTTVNGYPATLMVQDGAVIEMVYGTWTMSVAADKGVAGNAALTKGMPVLAGSGTDQGHQERMNDARTVPVSPSGCRPAGG